MEIGRALYRKIIDIHQGKVFVEAGKAAGTVIPVILPLL